jgi:hypothetical protein
MRISSCVNERSHIDTANESIYDALMVTNKSKKLCNYVGDTKFRENSTNVSIPKGYRLDKLLRQTDKLRRRK